MDKNGFCGGKEMKIGVLCPANIAMRRFVPALNKVDDFEFAGVAVNTPQERYGIEMPCEEITAGMLQRNNAKAAQIVKGTKGKIYNGFQKMIDDPEIDALYIPLPPALHHKWAKKALQAGKHILLEKPFTTDLLHTKELVEIAKSKGLALHENYMFLFHSQIVAIDEIIRQGKIGNVRLYRINFGFPFRAKEDFRYNKELGGGALLDAGGYTIKYAGHLLGENAKIAYAQLNYVENFDVDIYGSGAMVNSEGVVAQIAFGMDNDYKCELEVWGSDACLCTGRVLTAPDGYVPSLIMKCNNSEEHIQLEADDSFEKSIMHFYDCISNAGVREKNYFSIMRQAELIDEFFKLSGVGYGEI